MIQALWAAYVLTIGAMLLLGLPHAVRMLRLPCDGPSCLPWQLSSAQVFTLRGYGVSMAPYATFQLVYGLMLFSLGLLQGLVLMWRRPDHRVAQLCAVVFVALGATNTHAPDALASVYPALWPLANGLTFIRNTGLLAIYALFPNGRFVPRWSRWPVLGLLLLYAVVALFPALSPHGTPLDALLNILLPISLVAAIGFQIYRYRWVATPVQRQQAKWVLYGIAVQAAVFVGLSVSIPLDPSVLQLGTPANLAVNAVAGLSVLLSVGSFGVAILRHRLFDIDLIINRTLVYGVLSILVAGTYVLVVGGLGALLQARGSRALSLVAAGLVAVLFYPLREQIQRGVNRLLYGRRAEPYTVVAQLGVRLESTFTPTAVLPTIVTTLAEALRLPYVAITLGPEEDSPVITATGAPAGAPVAFPLHYQGALVGRLLVCPRRGEAVLSPTDRRLLTELAQQAGAAVHGVRLMDELRQLNADLRRSRERQVLAREEERRRIRRDLHDDLAPTLAGLALDADTVADLVPAQPERAQALARALNVQIRAAVGGIRQLVHDLRPPTIDEYGLLAALRERAAQLGARGQPVITVEAPEALPPLPAAVEVAAYRIVQEALMNVVKHAGARHCTVRVALGEGLEVVVADDGVGMLPAQAPGVGRRSMRERAEELGGELALEAADGGGTVVRVRLPLAREETP